FFEKFSTCLLNKILASVTKICQIDELSLFIRTASLNDDDDMNNDDVSDDDVNSDDVNNDDVNNDDMNSDDVNNDDVDIYHDNDEENVNDENAFSKQAKVSDH